MNAARALPDPLERLMVLLLAERADLATRLDLGVPVAPRPGPGTARTARARVSSSNSSVRGMIAVSLAESAPSGRLKTVHLAWIGPQRPVFLGVRSHIPIDETGACLAESLVILGVARTLHLVIFCSRVQPGGSCPAGQIGEVSVLGVDSDAIARHDDTLQCNDAVECKRGAVIVRIVRINAPDAQTHGDSSRPVVGVVQDGGVHPLPPDWSTLAVLTSCQLGSVLQTAPRMPTNSSGLRWQVPLDKVTTVRDCVGFLDHIRNARRARGVTDDLPPAWSSRPAFYFANSMSFRPFDADIEIPQGCAAFDYELEIGAVLGRGGANLTPEQAGECIAGYVLYCDWSCRDVQAEERTMQIGQGKAKDAAISLGPWILTADEAKGYRRPDGFEIDVSVHVNDEPVLRSGFRGMDWSFEELVAYASYGSAVSPGDVIASGTVPGGCLLELSGSNDFRGWLQPGDRVRLTAGPLGEISVGIKPSAPAPSWRHDQTHREGSLR